MNVHPPPESPQAWLERARSDLALADIALRSPDVLLEDACFHTQQCAEKALKALLLQQDIPFPRTHVIEMLLDLLQASGIVVPADVDEAFVLTQYAVQTRYPGAWEPVTQEEARLALDIATCVLAWVEEQLAQI
jgi:HEPN domain-containing protein